MIDFKTLMVSHNSIRNHDQLEDMLDYVGCGGVFDYKSYRGKPITINRFKDGRHMIHDGHHRCLAILLNARKLDPREYVVREYNYKDYLDIKFLTENEKWLGWVTPFNVLSEVRVADFGNFKDHVKFLYWKQSPDHALHYILTSKNKYLEERKSYLVIDLVHSI